MKKCKRCGKIFESTNKNKKYCCYDCACIYKNELSKLKSKVKHIEKVTNSKSFHVDDIMELKFLTFSNRDLYKCPLDPDNSEMYCGSYNCKNEIMKFGCSRCQMFRRS